MRKAAGLGSLRGSRKKQPTGPPDSKEDRPHVVNSIPAQPSHPPPTEIHQHRRKPSAEEGALTSKNYRLAKELSDLRVRHREECKNVTRLTMENMNLASRCREAISHVAMLKKELALHQSRAAEALALQREQTQRMASNLSAEVSRLSQSFSEDDDNMMFPDSSTRPIERDRILAALPPPPPPPNPPTSQQRVEKTAEKSAPHPQPPSDLPGKLQNSISPTDAMTPERRGSSPRGEFASDAYGDDGNSERRTVSPNDDFSPGSSSVDDKPNRIAVVSQPLKVLDDETTEDDNGDEPKGLTLFPHTASPKGFSSREYNEEFPADVIPRTHRQRLPPEAPDQHEDSSVYSKDSASSPVLSTAGSQASGRRDPATLSSIDAFEASFDTDFPAMFSPRDDEIKRKPPSPSGIYNPFHPSPAKSPALVESDLEETAELDQPTLELELETHLEDSNLSHIGIRDALPPTNSPPRLTRVSQPTTPEEKKADPSDIGYRTPPHDSQTVPASHSGQPKRPEKTVPESARARYKKALQPRNSDASSRNDGQGKTPGLSVDTAQSAPFDGTHSSLLNRIQQRRVKQNMNGSSAPEFSDRKGQGSLSGEFSRENQARSNSARSASERPFDEVEEGAWYTEPKTEIVDTESSVNNSFESIPAEENSSKGQNRGGKTLTKAARLAFAMKLRRNVKQPISYAEPALNTKLRKGDTYFTKGEHAPAPLVTPDAGAPVNIMRG